MVQEEGITKLLMAPGELKNVIPGISGTRALGDNLSDMKAQVASNFKGIGLVTALIEEYTLEVVQAYMHHIQVRLCCRPCNWQTRVLMPKGASLEIDLCRSTCWN